MPTFDFTSPEGKTYSVQGPEGATSEQAFQMLQQHLGTAQPSVGAGEDAAKSVAAGLGNATIGTLGMVGDARSLLSKGVDALGNKLGVDLSPVKSAASMSPLGGLEAFPTSEQVASTVSNPVVSPDYQPQTGVGGVLKTGAEFLPAMADPELLGPKAAQAAGRLLLTNVAAPAVASEAAGALTKGTDAEPYARIGGALLGGAGAGRFANSLSEARALKAATPALKDLKSDTSAGYDALTASNVANPLPVNSLDNLSADIRDTLNKKGIRPTNASSIHSAVEELKTPATTGAPDVADLVASRQSIKDLLGSPDTNKAGAFVALNKIEQAIEQASPGKMQELKELDKNWGAVKANEALDKKLARAELNNAGAHSGFNLGNQIRQQVKNLLNSSQAKYLSEDTKAELTKVVKGTWTSNGLRAVSKAFGSGGGLGALAAGAEGYHEGGVPGAIAAGLAGRALGHADAFLTAQRAAKAAQMIRRASPAGQKVPLLLGPQTSTALSALSPALLARQQFNDLVKDKRNQ